MGVVDSGFFQMEGRRFRATHWFLRGIFIAIRINRFGHWNRYRTGLRFELWLPRIRPENPVPKWSTNCIADVVRNTSNDNSGSNYNSTRSGTCDYSRFGENSNFTTNNDYRSAHRVDEQSRRIVVA